MNKLAIHFGSPDESTLNQLWFTTEELAWIGTCPIEKRSHFISVATQRQPAEYQTGEGTRYSPYSPEMKEFPLDPPLKRAVPPDVIREDYEADLKKNYQTIDNAVIAREIEYNIHPESGDVIIGRNTALAFLKKHKMFIPQEWRDVTKEQLKKKERQRDLLIKEEVKSAIQRLEQNKAPWTNKGLINEAEVSPYWAEYKKARKNDEKCFKRFEEIYITPVRKELGFNRKRKNKQRLNPAS